MLNRFISDVHLEASQPHLTQLFTNFLNEQPKNLEALYILGDLFSLWLGADVEPSYVKLIFETIEAATKRFPIYIMPGNRDFLLSEACVVSKGCRYLSDPTLIVLEGIPTLLTHGDLLCTQDIRYQRFRKLTHCTSLQKIFMRLPASIRTSIAGKITAASKADLKPQAITDVCEHAVLALLERYGAGRIIHGHTHRPALRWLKRDQSWYQHVVLSDWSSLGNVLTVDERSAQLSYF